MAKSFKGFNQPFEVESIEMTPPVAGSTRIKLFETSSCTVNIGKINYFWPYRVFDMDREYFKELW